jgi:hypothetical protein
MREVSGVQGNSLDNELEKVPAHTKFNLVMQEYMSGRISKGEMLRLLGNINSVAKDAFIVEQRHSTLMAAELRDVKVTNMGRPESEIAPPPPVTEAEKGEIGSSMDPVTRNDDENARRQPKEQEEQEARNREQVWIVVKDIEDTVNVRNAASQLAKEIHEEEELGLHHENNSLSEDTGLASLKRTVVGITESIHERNRITGHPSSKSTVKPPVVPGPTIGTG